MARCTLCNKTTLFISSRSRSMKTTRRVVRPNLQSIGGLVLCTRCLRTLRKPAKPAPAVG